MSTDTASTSGPAAAAAHAHLPTAWQLGLRRVGIELRQLFRDRKPPSSPSRYRCCCWSSSARCSAARSRPA